MEKAHVILKQVATQVLTDTNKSATVPITNTAIVQKTSADQIQTHTIADTHDALYLKYLRENFGYLSIPLFGTCIAVFVLTLIVMIYTTNNHIMSVAERNEPTTPPHQNPSTLSRTSTRGSLQEQGNRGRPQVRIVGR